MDLDHVGLALGFKYSWSVLGTEALVEECTDDFIIAKELVYQLPLVLTVEFRVR